MCGVAAWWPGDLERHTACRLPTARSQRVYARGMRHVLHWDARAHALRTQHKSSVLRTQFSTAALSETSEQCHCGACRPHAAGCLTVATENRLQEVFGRFPALGQGITRIAVLDQGTMHHFQPREGWPSRYSARHVFLRVSLRLEQQHLPRSRCDRTHSTRHLLNASCSPAA